MESVNLNWLRRARRQKHLTIERVAEMVGKDKSTIWRWESGITSLSVDMLFKLLELYQLSIMDVVVREGGDGH